MTVITIDEYVKRRESYRYQDPDCHFEVGQTVGLDNVGAYCGIYPRTLPSNKSAAVNLRTFEVICQEVFKDCLQAYLEARLTSQHVKNLKSIVSAIVHWKMASQGRAKLKVKNVQDKWTDDTVVTLVQAFGEKDVTRFLGVGGVLIPTATAFMRFLFPDLYGIVDSRVAPFTNDLGVTQFSLSKHKSNRGYIYPISKNIRQYNDVYVPFLSEEARSLNSAGARFRDVNSLGETIESLFRPCDVEMALWEGVGP